MWPELKSYFKNEHECHFLIEKMYLLPKQQEGGVILFVFRSTYNVVFGGLNKIYGIRLFINYLYELCNG